MVHKFKERMLSNLDSHGCLSGSSELQQKRSNYGDEDDDCVYGNGNGDADGQPHTRRGLDGVSRILRLSAAPLWGRK